MKATIIIPFFNMWSLTHARLMDLYNFAPKDCEILVVDDASTERDCLTGLAWWQKRAAREDLPIRYKRNEENLGFGQSCNVGAKYAKGDVLIFLSNDVIVRGDFITPIRNILTEKPGALIGGRLVDWPGGWNEVEFDGKKSIVIYAEGWLLSCRKETWEKLGGFDPLFGRFDMEDVDLSTKAAFGGIELIGLNSPYLNHISGATISTLPVDRYQITIENRQKYIDKWRDTFLSVGEPIHV